MTPGRLGHPEALVHLTGYWPEYDWEFGPKHWRTEEFYADEKVAPLLELCWKYGICTAGSCQGGPGGGPGSTGDETMVGFGQRKDMWLFRRLVGGFRPGWTWQGDYRKFNAAAGKWAVFFPYQQLPAVIRTVRAFGPFYGQPPKPPAAPKDVELQPLPLDEWLATAVGRP